LRAFRSLERGEAVDPHFSTLTGIAGALDMSVAELVGEHVPSGKVEAPSPSPDEGEERRASKLEEIREHYRPQRQALDAYCDLWEERLRDDKVSSELRQEFVITHCGWAPYLLGEMASEGVHLWRVLDKRGDLEATRAESVLIPVADRYFELARKMFRTLREDIRDKRGSEEPEGAYVAYIEQHERLEGAHVAFMNQYEHLRRGFGKTDSERVGQLEVS
jgi:transcriptional regulator with XRE-family HTH domain